MSGRVYGLTHTAAANTHTHRRRNGCSRMHRECLRNKHVPSFSSKRRQNVNNARLQSRKANKHSCYMQNYGQTQTGIPHTCDHKVSYHTNSVWLTSWGEVGGGGRRRNALCVCVFPLGQSVSYDTKPSFLSSKFSVIRFYKRPGYSFQATWTNTEAPV